VRLLCKPSCPSESPRTRDLWGPSLISQGTPSATDLESIPRAGPADLTSASNTAVNTSLGLMCRVSVGWLGLPYESSPQGSISGDKCCTLFLARGKICCCYSVPRITLFFCPTEAEVKKVSLKLQRGASLQAPCPRAVQRSHQLLLTKELMSKSRIS